MNAFCVNAKDYFVDGQKAFDAGNYAEAINNFEAGANAGVALAVQNCINASWCWITFRFVKSSFLGS